MTTRKQCLENCRELRIQKRKITCQEPQPFFPSPQTRSFQSMLLRRRTRGVRACHSAKLRCVAHRKIHPQLARCRATTANIATYFSVDPDHAFGVPSFRSRWSNRHEHKALAITDEDGWIAIFGPRALANAQSSGRENEFTWTAAKQRWIAHLNAVFDAEWGFDDKTIVTSSGDQTSKVFDVERAKLLCTFKGHSGSVKCTKCSPANPHIFASGARDGQIMLWDTRIGGEYISPTHVLRDCHGMRRGSKQSVTSLSFMPHGLTLVSAGAPDGCIKFWDARITRLKRSRVSPVQFIRSYTEGARPFGISSLGLDSSGSRVLASYTNSRIRVFSTLLPHRDIHTFVGHQNDSFYVEAAFSADGAYVVSGSCDNCVYIWDANGSPTPVLSLDGHQGEVTGVAWDTPRGNNLFGRLVSCSDDATVRIWSLDTALHPEKLLPEARAREHRSPDLSLDMVEVGSRVSTTPPPFDGTPGVTDNVAPIFSGKRRRADRPQSTSKRLPAPHSPEMAPSSSSRGPSTPFKRTNQTSLLRFFSPPPPPPQRRPSARRQTSLLSYLRSAS